MLEMFRQQTVTVDGRAGIEKYIRVGRASTAGVTPLEWLIAHRKAVKKYQERAGDIDAEFRTLAERVDAFKSKVSNAGGIWGKVKDRVRGIWDAFWKVCRVCIRLCRVLIASCCRGWGRCCCRWSAFSGRCSSPWGRSISISVGLDALCPFHGVELAPRRGPRRDWGRPRRFAPQHAPLYVARLCFLRVPYAHLSA